MSSLCLLNWDYEGIMFPHLKFGGFFMLASLFNNIFVFLLTYIYILILTSKPYFGATPTVYIVVRRWLANNVSLLLTPMEFLLPL